MRLGSWKSKNKAVKDARARKRDGIDANTWRGQVQKRAGGLGFDRETVDQLALDASHSGEDERRERRTTTCMIPGSRIGSPDGIG